MARRARRLPYAFRLVRARPRLFGSMALSLFVLLVQPAAWRLATRILVAWDIGIGLYLALAYHVVGGARVVDIRRRAALEDEGRIGILVLTVASALASFGAIFAELASSTVQAAGRQPHQLILGTVTILLSWALTHTIFAMHYAHEFYGGDGGEGGLQFPGGGDPDYWDFVYFSFVIGMTSQVSDVAIASKSIRRTATAHGVVSFVFNAALVALTVNIAASVI